MQEYTQILNQDQYLSNQTILLWKKEFFSLFSKIQRKKYLLIFSKYRTFYYQYKNIEQLTKEHNKNYIQKKLIETKPLLDNIKGYSLDRQQRECVLNEEDALLVIAGAGSGKSLTIIAKICYLIEERGYQEKEILCISFTNASSKSLEESIFKHYGYQIKVLTFHKLALQILQSEEIIITQSDTLEYLIDEFYHSIILQIPKLIQIVVHYFHPYQIGTIEEYQKILVQPKFLLFQKKIAQFIHLFKANGQEEEKLYQNLKKTYSNQEYYFLIQVIVIWNLYQQELAATHSMDFDDMIIKAIHHLDNPNVYLPYRYIIIDEYQDSSLLRCQLIQKIIECTHAKIMAVGDDFQSIYRFSGCDLTIFLDFKKYFDHADILKIGNTYRNSQELIELAGKFVMKNKKQIQKELSSSKHYSKPIKILYYEDAKEKFKDLLSYFLQEKKKEILVLGRNKKDIESILSPEIQKKENYYFFQDLQFQYMTVHQSKGLESEIVVLIHLENSTMGFPNKLEDDSTFRFLNLKNEEYAYAEERRLFYVALTRTKNENYLFVPTNKESMFVKELKKDFSNKIEILSIKEKETGKNISTRR